MLWSNLREMMQGWVDGCSMLHKSIEFLQWNLGIDRVKEFRFDLTFQKWFVSFPNVNNCKTDLKCRPPCLDKKKIFHSKLPKTALDIISFTSLSYWWKASDWHLILENFYKKNVLKNCTKNQFKINYVEFHIHAEMNHLLFYWNCTNQTFTFFSSTVVYLRSIPHFTHSTLREQRFHCY